MKKLFLSLLIFTSFASSAQQGFFSRTRSKNGTSPTQVSYTYATMNPSDKSANISLSGGNLVVNRNGGAGVVRATIGKASGKWYWEATITAGASPDCFLGVANATAVLTGNLGANVNGWSVVMDDGGYYNNGAIGLTGGTTFPAVAGDVFGFELDCGAGTFTVYRNNTALTPNPLFTNVQGQFVYPAMSEQANDITVTYNFGSSAFTYTGHTGFNQGIYN